MDTRILQLPSPPSAINPTLCYIELAFPDPSSATGFTSVRAKIIDIQKGYFPAIPIGNAGLSSGDVYFDTAANALANGDLVLIRKT